MHADQPEAPPRFHEKAISEACVGILIRASCAMKGPSRCMDSVSSYRDREEIERERERSSCKLLQPRRLLREQVLGELVSGFRV